ncbi:hypothetical protein [Candidatus Viadribacter manganicus]|nr:hypothetical protein [Candidatus Viadribacter manganicus]
MAFPIVIGIAYFLVAVTVVPHDHTNGKTWTITSSPAATGRSVRSS